MKSFTTIGRILFALPFGVFGVTHLINADKMTGMVPAYFPGGIIWIYITGIAMLAACVSIITKVQAKLATLLLALLLLVFVLTIHIPNLFRPEMMQFGLMGLLKDTGLMAGALILSGMFTEKDKAILSHS